MKRFVKFSGNRVHVMLAMLGLACAILTVVGLASVRLDAQEAVPTGSVPADQAALRINEFMADNATTLSYPGDSSLFPDWVEIFNPGASAVSLNGLSISDTEANPSRGEIPNGMSIPAGGYMLFYPGADAFLDFGLSKSGEFIGLFHVATGEMIDGNAFDAVETDQSIGRIPNGTGDFVLTDQPTPGLNNSQRPPLINDVTRDIAVPSSSDAPQVTANVTDDGSLVAVTLVYSSTGNADITVPMTLTSGSNWVASLPSFSDGTIVRYAVQAEDDEGLTATTRRFSYEVGYVAPVLFINEVVASNNELGHEDIDDPGRFPDWAEIYNPGSAPVSLDGLSLTDNAGDPTKYRIPDGKVVPAHGFIMVYLDEEPQKTTPTSKAIHADFNLSADGEYIGLYGGEGAALVDGFDFGEQDTLVAIGLYPDGEGVPTKLVCTTPGKANMLCEVRALLPFTFGPVEQAP